MTDDASNTTRTLAVTIVPKLDVQAFKDQMKDLGGVIAGAGSGDGTTETGPNTLLAELQSIKASVEKIAGKKQVVNVKQDQEGETVVEGQETGGQAQGSNKDKDKDAQARKLIATGLNTLFTGIQKGFGIVQQIYGKIKQSSAFLQAVENLFNLAMTLLFLPLGNALATVILPAMIDLVDSVLGLWDEMDEIFDESGGTLGAILDIVLNKGLQYFGDFFNKIADEIGKSNGIFGSIAKLMETIGNFITKDMAGVLNAILNGVGFVMRHLKEFISLYIGFKIAEATADVLGFFGDASGGKGWTKLGIYSAVLAGSTLTAEAGLTAIGMASGGYVPATEGGQLHLLGEGGEGEYVIPESKMRNVGGNITNNFYGYTTEELRFTVRDTIRDEITRSKYTGGF